MNANDVISRTGQLLLNGWKLLAISCPICNTALLSSRAGEMKCPGCNLPVVLESNETSGFASSPPVNTSMKSPEQRNNKFNTNHVSKLIGEKLLQGWAMTNEVCDNIDCRSTPLMRDPSSLIKVCLNCGLDYMKKSENIAVCGLDETDEISDEELFDDSPIINFQNTNQDANDPSQNIAKMLLKGWCLLDVCCNSFKCNGTVPLMRNLEGEVCCVVCSTQSAVNVSKSISKTKDTISRSAQENTKNSGDNNLHHTQNDKERSLSVLRKKLQVSLKELDKADTQSAVHLSELICKLGSAIKVLKELEEDDFKTL